MKNKKENEINKNTIDMIKNLENETGFQLLVEEAKVIFKLYLAFMEAGFDKGQAFEFVMRMQLNSPTKGK